jgi:hypothetical protein
MIESLKLREPLFIKPSVGLMDLLSLFQDGQSHIAFVTSNPLGSLEAMRKGVRPPTEKEGILGVVTMEDVLEKIIQRDIVDETDAYRPIRQSLASAGYSSANSRGSGYGSMTINHNPSILYHNPAMRSRVYNTSHTAHSGSSSSGAASRYAGGGGYVSKNHRRPRIFAAGSVVTSDYYTASRIEHFGLPEKEDVVQVNNAFKEIFGDNSEKAESRERDDSISPVPNRNGGKVKVEKSYFQLANDERAYDEA